MSEVTKWSPRRVYCTERPDHTDGEGVAHVVKYRRGTAHSAACAISEVICGELLSAGGVPTLERRFVHVTAEFAAQTAAVAKHEVAPGLHFGTVLLENVENGPANALDEVSDPQTIVDIWAFDTWWCNLDRDNEGNVLLRIRTGSKLEVIAADQSDCFGGCDALVSGAWRARLTASGPAQVKYWDQAATSVGLHAVSNAVARIERARDAISAAIAMVPNAWWAESTIRPNEIEEALDTRAPRVETLLNQFDWAALAQLFQGAHHVL